MGLFSKSSLIVVFASYIVFCRVRFVAHSGRIEKLVICSKDESTNSASEAAERKRIAKETSREHKWLNMMARWNEGKRVPKLASRVWKGVPEKLRSVVTL